MKKLIVFLILLLAGTSFATNKYVPYYFSGESTDSVMIIQYEINTPSRDTVIKKTFPVSDSLVIDDTKDYKISYLIFYDGDTTIPSGTTSEFIKGTASTTSDTLAIARAVTRDIVDSAVARTDVFYGPSALTGNTYTHNIKIIDTSDNTTPDSTLAYIDFSVENVAGSNVGSNSTNGLGRKQITLDSGSYVFKIFHPLYTATSVTDTITANGDSTIIRAYDTHATNTCRVWGYIIDGSSDSLYGAVVRFSLPPGIKMNTCDSSIIVNNYVKATTNSDGYFYADLMTSNCLNDKKYKVEVYYNDILWVKGIELTVPDSTTYQLNF